MQIISGGAEDDLVVGSGGAGECAGLVVFGVAVGVGALALEEPRVVRRRAVVLELAPAAVRVAAELAARARAPSGHLQLWQAFPGDVYGFPKVVLFFPKNDHYSTMLEHYFFSNLTYVVF